MEARQKHAGAVCERPERIARLSWIDRHMNNKERRMGHPAQHHKINYIEFSTTSVAKTKAFYSKVFGWEFQDWGEDYVSFSSKSGGIDGGFRTGPVPERTGESAPLIVLYSADLKATETAVVSAGGSVVLPTFEFPGGRRFHFSDGAGNVLAVWSE